MIPVSRVWTLPTEEPVSTGLDVLGRTLLGLAGCLAHLGGIQAQGFATLAAYQGPAIPTDDGDVGWILGEVLDEEHRLPFFVPEGVDEVMVAVEALSYVEGGAAAPSVVVSAYDATGNLIDAGFTLDRASGLPGKALQGGRGLRLWPAFGQSSAAKLSLGDCAGQAAVIHIDTTRALIVSALVCPLWPETL